MKQHPFDLSFKQLKTIGNFDRQNENVRNLFPNNKESSLTSQALEKEGSIDPLIGTTEALNEEGGSDDSLATTLAIGEEGGDFPGDVTDVPRAIGSSDDSLATTLAIGEEGGDFPGDVIDPLGGQGSQTPLFFSNPIID